MHFKDIEINGFRGIKHLKIDGLRDINLLVGRNNCGKSTVLEAIFLMVGISNPELVLRINQFRDLLLTVPEDLKFIFYNLNFDSELSLKVNLNKNHSFRELKIKPSSINTAIKVDLKTDNGKFLTGFDTGNSEKEINELIFSFNIKESNKQKTEYISKFQINSSNLNFSRDKNYNEKLKGVYLPTTVNMANNLEKELDDIIKSKKEKEIIEILSKVDEKIQNIAFGTNHMIYLDIGIEKLIPLNLAGDGIRRLLSIILSIYNSKNGILLIDELENGLHYSTLKLLWKAVLEASKRFNVQIFVTSHNIETLKFLKDALEESTNEDKNRVASITLRKFDNGNTKAYNYDFDKFEYSLEQGLEIR